jgi:replicative DNA helicase
MNEQELKQKSERNVIAGILLKPENFNEARNILRSEDFSDYIYRSIFSVCENLYKEGRNITPDNIISQLLDIDNIHEIIINIIEGTYDYIDFLVSCQKVREISKKQNLLKMNKEIESILKNPGDLKVDDLEKVYQKSLERNIQEEIEESKNIMDILDAVVERKKRREEGKPLIEIDTGYSLLNKFTKGFHRGDLIILAARPGMGKTALMLNMAIKQVRNGEKVMIFSLEMAMELLVERMVAEISGVSLQKIRGGDLTNREFDKVVEAFDFLKSVEDNLIILDNSNMTINEIKLEIRKHKVDVVYIDYLQLINSSSEYNNKNVEVGEVSRIAKVMARELKVAVVMLAQLSREVERRTNKKPVLSDLRDSGEIEQNADIVLFLYRPDYYTEIGQEIETEETEIIIAKHRNGPTGSIKLYFEKETLEFIEYEEGV